jgi:hypothetical protein
MGYSRLMRRRRDTFEPERCWDMRGAGRTNAKAKRITQVRADSGCGKECRHTQGYLYLKSSGVRSRFLFSGNLFGLETTEMLKRKAVGRKVSTYSTNLKIYPAEL